MNLLPDSNAAASDDDAWPVELVQLYRDRFGDLVRVAYLMTGHLDIAEELVQEAFLSTRQHIRRVQAPYAYLRAAVVNRARSWHRRRRLELRRRPQPIGPSIDDPDEMWDALQKLEPKRRAAIVLRFYEQLDDREIASILKCAQPTVRTLVRRGLAELRKDLEQ